MAIGDFSRHRLRGHRNGLGLSIAEVAAAVGLSDSAISSYETGSAQPSAAMLDKLAELYGVPTEDLYQKHNDDGTRDYVSAVVSQMPPMSDADIQTAAAILRRIGQRMDKRDNA